MIVKKSIPEDSLQIFKNKKLEIEHKSYALIDSIKQNNPASFLTKILTAMEMNNPDSINYTDPDYLRTPFYDKLIRLFIKKNINNNTQTIISETTKLLNSIPDTLPNYQYILNYLLNFYNNYYKNGINEVFVFLADNYFLPDKANWINKEALIKLKERRDFLAQGLPGMTASDLTLESATGEYFSVLQVEAKMTLLYFWSADCGHCTKSTQILKNNYEALSKKGIEIFAVNVDKEKDKWLRKPEENELPWINCYHPKETSHYRDKYYVYGSPLLIIIGQNKKILAVENGEIEIENFVNQLTK
jgi:thiol-disulfide isomerase/thioredoxin